MHTATPVMQCFDMTLVDFIQYFEDLCDEAERTNKEIERRR